MKMISLLSTATLLAALSVSATPAPEGARVYFISPADGDTLSSEFTVRFGLEGMGVAPAGVVRENTGHHHLLINQESMPDLTQPLPANDQIRHFGGGQTETELELAPGEYKLQLVLGDAQHVPHQPALMSDVITVTVK
ncbi:DUF4399 domain-containing protein [Oceanisphaera sp.]|uniref:DUF4399 domain-containing protein n=1 Tax=Oceanisphaera sp. TaxID=1929979 RepID=UPI003A9374C4